MNRLLRAGLALPLGMVLLCLSVPVRCLGAGEAGSGVEGTQISPVTKAPDDEGVLGVATYYAKRYVGRKTASGERYRPEKLTAAHPDLPFGTRVKVIHLESERAVVVTVNDRCKRRKLPAIDLSKAAAKQLGVLREGRARVRIVALRESTPIQTLDRLD